MQHWIEQHHSGAGAAVVPTAKQALRGGRHSAEAMMCATASLTQEQVDPRRRPFLSRFVAIWWPVITGGPHAAAAIMPVCRAYSKMPPASITGAASPSAPSSNVAPSARRVRTFFSMSTSASSPVTNASQMRCAAPWLEGASQG
jgi:hypothetical protein